jgi:hypothetical protein
MVPGDRPKAHFPAEAHRVKAGHRRKEVIDMVNSNPKGATTPKGFETKVQKALAGMQKYLPSNSTLDINGATKTVAQIEADFSAMLTKYADVRNARAQWLLAVQVVRKALPAEHEEYLALKKVLEGKLGRGNPQLVEYGFSVGTPKSRTAATIVAAAAKAKATRAIRHTLGRKQKLALSDAVTEPSVVVLAPGGKPMSVGTTTAATPMEPTPVAANGQGASPKP